MTEEKERRNFYITPLKYNRIRSYIDNLEQNIKISNKKDKEIVAESKVLVNDLIKKLKNYYRLNFILYFAIYFSFVSYIFSDIVIISQLAEAFGKIIGVVGTTVFFIALYFSNQIIDLYYQDLNLITAHLISIYSKHQKENVEEIAETTGNYYKTYIEFFKSRGF